MDVRTLFEKTEPGIESFLGAEVVGIDIASNLVEAGNRRARGSATVERRRRIVATRKAPREGAPWSFLRR